MFGKLFYINLEMQNESFTEAQILICYFAVLCRLLIGHAAMALKKFNE